MPELTVEETPIPGLQVIRLPLHEDSRGWFKENWQRAKMTGLGLPDIRPVQQNVSFNVRRGVTRGIHAEPWDKLVSVATGRVFGAWVDLREGPSFGRTHHVEVDPSVAVFVPRGVGNAYQSLEDATAYIYLVNDHWRAGHVYPALALDDASADIPWPIPLDRAEVSEKDHHNPRLEAVSPMLPKRTLILGAHGQLGRALSRALPAAECVDRPRLDLSDSRQVTAWPWHEYQLVLNAAAYTSVDAAETPAGRASAWATNAAGPMALATLAQQHGFTLVHFSTDYVFDGIQPVHQEDEPVSPLGVYGQSKAAGDLAVATAPHHYVLRTSWLVGDGNNFVRTMARLAATGVGPSVVDDQMGRLTSADELARAAVHLLDSAAPFGTYNCTNAGPPTSWADVARAVFERCGRSADDVTPVSTDEYAAGKNLAPRPASSVLDLSKLEATGFMPEDATTALDRYVASLSAGDGA